MARSSSPNERVGSAGGKGACPSLSPSDSAASAAVAASSAVCWGGLGRWLIDRPTDHGWKSGGNQHPSNRIHMVARTCHGAIKGLLLPLLLLSALHDEARRLQQ